LEVTFTLQENLQPLPHDLMIIYNNNSDPSHKPALKR
jgi:hypothetical protein